MTNRGTADIANLVTPSQSAQVTPIRGQVFFAGATEIANRSAMSQPAQAGSMPFMGTSWPQAMQPGTCTPSRDVLIQRHPTPRNHDRAISRSPATRATVSAPQYWRSHAASTGRCQRGKRSAAPAKSRRGRRFDSAVLGGISRPLPRGAGGGRRGPTSPAPRAATARRAGSGEVPAPSAASRRSARGRRDR